MRRALEEQPDNQKELAMNAVQTEIKPRFWGRMWKILEAMATSPAEYTLDRMDAMALKVQELELKTIKLEALLAESRGD